MSLQVLAANLEFITKRKKKKKKKKIYKRCFYKEIFSSYKPLLLEVIVSENWMRKDLDILY